MSIITNDILKQLCKRHNWFTLGSTPQFEKLLGINSYGCDLDELTTAIWICSIQNRCDIKDVIELEYNEQKRLLHERAVQITEYINRKVPSGWNRMSLDERRVYIELSYTEYEQLDCLVERERICALEVWCELLNGDIESISVQDVREINRVITEAEGWEDATNKPQRFGPYGVQRGFIRSKKQGVTHL